jgi:O-antigen ligase
MRNNVEKDYRRNIIFISILILFISTYSFASLSVATIFFITCCCFHTKILQQVKNLFHHPVLWSISLLFLIPFISGLWSQDVSAWAAIMQDKLPLLLFPLSFAGFWQLRKKQWLIIAITYLAVIIIGSLYGVYHYLLNMEAVHESYLRAKTIPTPFNNDHLRFSIAVAVAILISAFLIERTTTKKYKIILVLLIIFLTIYLHLLAARAGLLCLYIFLFLYFIKVLLAKNKNLLKVAIASAIILLPIAAYMLLPTFQNRIKYLRYDLSYGTQNSYLPGGNDANRILSLKAGWHILKNNPFGVGAGDIQNETFEWYDTHVPEMQASDKLYPSSEWLMHGAAAGWAGVILFTVIILYLIFYPHTRYRFYWLNLQLFFMIGFAIDTGLGIQYGIFLFSFLSLLWWKFSAEFNAEID